MRKGLNVPDIDKITLDFFQIITSDIKAEKLPLPTKKQRELAAW
jgi:hypothetical protein